MDEILLNNVWMIVGTIVVGAIAWTRCRKITRTRLRRSLQVSVVYFSFPVVFIGHPPLFAPVWAALIGSLLNGWVRWAFILAMIWVAIVGIAQFGVLPSNAKNVE